MGPMQATLPSVPAWRDPKRWLWPLSALFPGLVWLNLLRFEWSGQVAWLFMAALVIYAVIPLLDALLGEDRRNPPPEAVAALEADPWYRLLVPLFIPLQYGLLVHGCWLATQHAGEAWVWAGLVLSVGGINGVGINTAHELGHKHPVWERWLARVALAPVAYGHFFVEHNRRHLRRPGLQPPGRELLGLLAAHRAGRAAQCLGIGARTPGRPWPAGLAPAQ